MNIGQTGGFGPFYGFHVFVAGDTAGNFGVVKCFEGGTVLGHDINSGIG